MRTAGSRGCIPSMLGTTPAMGGTIPPLEGTTTRPVTHDPRGAVSSEREPIFSTTLAIPGFPLSLLRVPLSLSVLGEGCNHPLHPTSWHTPPSPHPCHCPSARPHPPPVPPATHWQTRDEPLGEYLQILRSELPGADVCLHFSVKQQYLKNPNLTFHRLLQFLGPNPPLAPTPTLASHQSSLAASDGQMLMQCLRANPFQSPSPCVRAMGLRFVRSRCRLSHIIAPYYAREPNTAILQSIDPCQAPHVLPHPTSLLYPKAPS